MRTAADTIEIVVAAAIVAVLVVAALVADRRAKHPAPAFPAAPTTGARP